MELKKYDIFYEIMPVVTEDGSILFIYRNSSKRKSICLFNVL